MFQFDPNSTVNEGRWRLKDPKQFLPNSYFRRKSSTDGISYVMGLNNKSCAVEIQAIRFDKKLFTEKQAADWWDINCSKYDKTWTDDDWVKALLEEGTKRVLLN